MDGFGRLHPVVQHHVVNTLGWRELRLLQEDAVAPLIAGSDALLLAPTAGGKTEAALFPLLTRMAEEDWRGTSVLYLCPLKALLNNLVDRVSTYAAWLGRSAAVRHGDTSPGDRRRLVSERPDVLLTTPESLEAMLVSATVDPRLVLADVRVVVVDEVHAFAGDDRGWHLLAVLERLARLAGRDIQRVGLSATVGNAPQLLTWMQGSGAGRRSGRVVAPETVSGDLARTDVELGVDFVGSVDNAAKVISALHRGDKRLVFADSRRVVEQLAGRLRELGTDVFVSHSSLSAAERRRSETAFAEANDCAIVSTSTLELGIDVGDLDRVLQVGAPGTVASLLQRLGRTGRRPGTNRNMLMLATDDQELLRAFALVLLWGEGYVEPVVPTPSPNHVAAQQLLALSLQLGRVGRNTWPEWFADLPLATPKAWQEIVDWLIATGHLDEDSGMLFIGPEAERQYGRRHFMEIMSVFTSDPQMLILHGRNEIGVVDPMVMLVKIPGPRVIALGGRSWLVTSIDWSRRRAYVEPSEGRGLARWAGRSVPRSFELTDAMRRIVLGDNPPGVASSLRASGQISAVREEWSQRADSERTVLLREGDDLGWWTWAGGRANAVLHAALAAVAPRLLHPDRTFDNEQVSLNTSADIASLRHALLEVKHQFGPGLVGVLPRVDERAIQGLKFSDLLPPELAEATLASRLSEPETAKLIADRSIVYRGSAGTQQ